MIRRCVPLILLAVLVTACTTNPVALQSPVPSVQTPPSSALSSPSPVATPTLVVDGSEANGPDAPTSKSQQILQLKAGSGADQVGVTANAAPTTFRIAADGSIRIMDAVNKRLLFFNGSDGALQQTIDLQFLQQPTDFAVTGNGDLYVLDAGAWTIEHLAIDGTPIDTIPIQLQLRNTIKTISLAADNRLIGLGSDSSHVLKGQDKPIPSFDQMNSIKGGFTVRSNAIFNVYAEGEGSNPQLVANLAGSEVARFDIGRPEEAQFMSFLDLNQGMEPYIAIDRQDATEIRRYSVSGEEIGRMAIDHTGCREVARSLYVDRPGDVYAMCVNDAGVTITRYEMLDQQGQPLPRYDHLVETAPWSPGALQAAPG